MTETVAETTTEPEVGAEDRKARKAPAKPKTPVADPAAPYGYMRDPKTGEQRPKKRPGKAASTQPTPRERPGGQARTRPAAPDKKSRADTINELGQGIWLLLAAVPEVEEGTKMLGRDVYTVAMRCHAQAEIINTNSEGIVRGLVIMAEHSAPVAKAIDRAAAETGPAWILPAMMALLPFAVQSAAMWRAPVKGDVEAMAAKTKEQFNVVIKGIVEESSTDATADANGKRPA